MEQEYKEWAVINTRKNKVTQEYVKLIKIIMTKYFVVGCLL